MSCTGSTSSIAKINLPEKVDDKNILTSDGGFGGRLSKHPVIMSSKRSVIFFICGRTENKTEELVSEILT